MSEFLVEFRYGQVTMLSMPEQNQQTQEANDPNTVKIGEVIRLTHFQNHVIESGAEFNLSYVANDKRTKDKDKKVFVAYLLGMEPKYPQNGNDDLMDIEKRMNQLGWFRKDK